MTELDHSSVASLLNDLDRYDGCVFRFRFDSGNFFHRDWRLIAAAPVVGGIRFIVEHGLMQDGVWAPGPGPPEILCLLDDERLSRCDCPYDPRVVYPSMMVVVPTAGPLCSADGFQSRQLDDNLRGVFS